MLRDPTGLAYAVAAVAFGLVAALAWRRRALNPTVAVSLVVVMLGLGASCVADVVALESRDPATAAIASLVILPGVGFATGAFACLGFGIARPQWTPSPGLARLFLVEPLAITVAAGTNHWHRWVYTGVGTGDLSGSAEWGYGPAFWLHTGYSYAALFAGVGLIAVGWWRAPQAFRRQRGTILIATLVPCAANVVYLARGFGQVDPTPLGFAITGIVIAYALFRQDLFTLSPVERALILDQIGDAILVVNPDGRILDVNDAAARLVRAVSPAAPADLVGFSADVAVAVAAADGGMAIELPSGSAEFEVRRSPLIDRRRRAIGEVFVARDVTEAHHQSRRLAAANDALVHQVETIELLRAELVELASRDMLTGLHNRRFLVDRFEGLVATARAAAQAQGAVAPLGAILLDVDRFKLVNDRHGHLAGDQVLVALANLIENSAPAGALVARWGGEEFFLALPGADERAAVAFAEDLLRRCAELSITVDTGKVSCTLSAGVATFPASGTTINEIFHAADVALYEAKDAGRNVVRVSSPDLSGRFAPTAEDPLPGEDVVVGAVSSPSC